MLVCCQASGKKASFEKVHILPQVESASPAQSAYGFELVKQQYIHEYDSDVRLYRHSRTGENLQRFECDGSGLHS